MPPPTAAFPLASFTSVRVVDVTAERLDERQRCLQFGSDGIASTAAATTRSAPTRLGLGHQQFGDIARQQSIVCAEDGPTRRPVRAERGPTPRQDGGSGGWARAMGDVVSMKGCELVPALAEHTVGELLVRERRPSRRPPESFVTRTASPSSVSARAGTVGTRTPTPAREESAQRLVVHDPSGGPPWSFLPRCPSREEMARTARKSRSASRSSRPTTCTTTRSGAVAYPLQLSGQRRRPSSSSRAVELRGRRWRSARVITARSKCRAGEPRPRSRRPHGDPQGEGA